MFAIWKKFLPTSFKQKAMVGWYNYLGRINTNGEVLFLNHGFADPGAESPRLPEELEKHRYPIQLYHHILRMADLTGKDVLEVSSGLGGGIRWIAACLAARSITGLDIAESAIKSCRAQTSDAHVRFETGDAQAMPFADSSFDAVVNVESPLNNPDFAAFLRETVRVLRPGGYFMFADYRRAKRYGAMKLSLEQLEWPILLSEDISPAIVRGLDHTGASKRAAVKKFVPRFLHGTALRFARLDKGFDDERLAFTNGRKRYLAMVLQKPA